MSDIQWTGIAFGVIYALCVLVAPIDSKIKPFSKVWWATVPATLILAEAIWYVVYKCITYSPRFIWSVVWGTL